MKLHLRRTLRKLKTAAGAVVLLLVVACNHTSKRVAVAPPPPIDSSAGSRSKTIALPFAVSGDSGFLFSRDVIPALAKNSLISLTDSELRQRIQTNDTAGKFYRCGSGKFCCLFRWPGDYDGEMRMALIETGNGSATMLLSEDFPSAGTFWPTDWQDRFSKSGPFLSMITDSHGLGFNAEWVILMNPANLTESVPETPQHVWNAFGRPYQSLICKMMASDASIDCRCLLEADSDWFEREADDEWKADRRQTVLLPFRKRKAAWELIDSSGWKELERDWMLER